MGTVTSGTLYLAFSLAAGSHPGVVETRAATTPATAEAAQPAPQPQKYVIADLPRLDRPSKSLDAVIAEEVARESATQDDGGPVARNEAITGVNDAVVTEHDARIALLKQRIAALKSEAKGDTAAQLRDLGTRLKHAEAARALAIARAALTAPCVADCDAQLAKTTPDVSPAATPTAVTPVDFAPRRGDPSAAPKPRASHKARPPSAFVTTKRTIARAPRFHASQIFAAIPPIRRPNPRTWTAQRLAAGARFVLRPRGAVSGFTAGIGHLAVRVAAARMPAAKLQRSRQLLAKARKALEPSLHQHHIEIAGLWKFDGSERWSLDDFNRQTI